METCDTGLHPGTHITISRIKISPPLVVGTLMYAYPQVSRSFHGFQRNFDRTDSHHPPRIDLVFSSFFSLATLSHMG